MAKKKKSAVEEEVELNMTPMIDVTFQLLIFFIVTLKFRTLEKKLFSYLPTNLGLNTSNEIIDEMFITVKLGQPRRDGDPEWRSADKTLFYVESDKIDGPIEKALPKIRQRLESFRQQQKEAKGKIEAGFGVPHGQVVSVLDVFHQVGFETITFTGLTNNKNIAENEAWFNKIRKQLSE